MQALIEIAVLFSDDVLVRFHQEFWLPFMPRPGDMLVVIEDSQPVQVQKAWYDAVYQVARVDLEYVPLGLPFEWHAVSQYIDLEWQPIGMTSMNNVEWADHLWAVYQDHVSKMGHAHMENLDKGPKEPVVVEGGTKSD